MRTIGRFSVLALVLVTAPGCFLFTTKHEADEMRKRMDDLDGRVKKQESALDDKMQALDDSIDKSKKVLSRSSADLGAEVQSISQELAELRGQMSNFGRDVEGVRTTHNQLRADLEGRLAAAEQRLVALEQGLSQEQSRTQLDAQKGPLFTRAMQAQQSGKYADARKDFESYLRSFPSDTRAAEALFQLGVGHAQEKQYEESIAKFQRLIDVYPRSELVDDAFLAAGKSAELMRWCTDARAYYGVLVSRFPQSTLAAEAKKRGENLKKNAANKKICAS